jgi:c-di-GMP-binding flagellar brake protein YcgR
VLHFWQGLSEGRTKIENRKYPRVKICNTISYIGSGEDGTIQEQCLGVVLDISQNGLLIESIKEVESKNLSLVASTQKNSLIKIEGKVAYCRKAESGKFRTGILLQGTHEENVRFVKELIRAHHYQKK